MLKNLYQTRKIYPYSQRNPKSSDFVIRLDIKILGYIDWKAEEENVKLKIRHLFHLFGIIEHVGMIHNDYSTIAEIRFYHTQSVDLIKDFSDSFPKRSSFKIENMTFTIFDKSAKELFLMRRHEN